MATRTSSNCAPLRQGQSHFAKLHRQRLVSAPYAVGVDVQQRVSSCVSTPRSASWQWPQTRGCAARPQFEGCSCRVDDGNVTPHEPAWEHEHDIPPGPGSEGRGDTKRVRGAEGVPKARREGRIVWQRWSGRWGQPRGVGDNHQEARASCRGGERGSGRWDGGG
jgi:hypothetical protein